MPEENNVPVQQPVATQMPKLEDDKPLLEAHETAQVTPQQPAGYKHIEIAKEPVAAPTGVTSAPADVAGLKDILTESQLPDNLEQPAQVQVSQNSVYAKLFPVSVLLFLIALGAVAYFAYKYFTV